MVFLPFCSLRRRPRASILHLPRSLRACSPRPTTTASSSRSFANGLTMAQPVEFVDIGVNLLDDMYQGMYHHSGKQAHAPDVDAVLRRAQAASVRGVIITSSDLCDARAAIALCRRVNSSGAYPGLKLTTTVGLHPTSACQLEAVEAQGADALRSGSSGRHGALGPHAQQEEGGGSTAAAGGAHDMPELTAPLPSSAAEYISAMRSLCLAGKAAGVVVAVGECGLDYDRLHFSSKAQQAGAFSLQHAWQMDLAAETGLPLFLHDRNTGGDFLSILHAKQAALAGGAGPMTGVVHSFTGSEEEARAYIEQGFYIGLNGCSLKSGDNCAVAAALPLHRLLLETDAPWCGIKPSHASAAHVRTPWPSVKKEKYDPCSASPSALVRDRNEPCTIGQVAEVVAALKGVAVAEVARASTDNARALFGPHVLPPA